MSRSTRLLVGLATLLGLLGSVYLTYLHWVGTDAKSAFCDVLSKTGCSLALQSDFASLGGVPLSVLLVGIYSALLLALWQDGRQQTSRIWSGPATLISIGLLASGLFLLGVMAESGSYCPLCLMIDGVNLFLLLGWGTRTARGVGPLFEGRALVALGLSCFVPIGVGVSVLSQGNEINSKATIEPITWVDKERLTVKQCQDVELSALEISDFLCPYCKQLETNLSSVLAGCGARVDKRFVHFPLDTSCNRFVKKNLHPGACRLAEASECARLQGSFTVFASTLFEKTPRNDGALFKIVKDLGLNLAQFKQCLDSHLTRDRVRTDIELANRLGVRSTPTFYLNGRRLEGALSEAQIQKEVAKALAKDFDEAKNIANGFGANNPWGTPPVEACDEKSFNTGIQGCSAQ